MRIAMVNIPIRAPWYGPSAWITVPPQDYGGIQWTLANLIDGLLELGHEIVLLGAPGSPGRTKLRVIDAGQPEDIRNWLANHEDLYDVVHDHSVGEVYRESAPTKPYIGTWQLTGTTRYPCNPVYVSEAQRRQAKGGDAPVVRIPVNPGRYPLKERKDRELLFLGRISPWKGALEAADFGARCGRDVLIAGPSWDEPYRREIERRFASTTTFLGEVGGKRRLELLQRAAALLVLSQPVPGPWGDPWVEPGATVVSEAAACGTAVIASSNGCLAEIVPGVGRVVDEGRLPSASRCNEILNSLPLPTQIRSRAVNAWNHLKIAAKYVEIYERVQIGGSW